MDSNTPLRDPVHVAGAPNLPGLTFRLFRGEPDYPAMLAVIEDSKEVDGLERTDTVEDVARFYDNLVNCDPYQDMLFAEVDGDVVGYSRVMWVAGPEGQRYYRHYTYLLPNWRGKGIRRAMLRHSERRLVDIAAGHQETGPCWFETYALGTERHWENLLVAEGYQAAQYRFQMVRHDLTEIPDLPLPEGLEVRPVGPEDTYAVWLAAKEAYQEAWWYTEEGWSDQRYEGWKQDPTFDPSLWQVAWDGDQVAGMVLNYIDAGENREYSRKRGYTETICVRRPWRRRGLARALLARSFRVLQEQGLTEAALSVDAENPSGALRLYTSMGFEVEKRTAVYRKPLSRHDARRRATSMDKAREILEELRMVLAGRSSFLDSLLPPIVFVLLNTIWGVQVAIWASLGLAVAIAIYRLLRRQSLLYALGGAGGVALAAAVAYLLGRAEGFFLSTIISGALTVLLCLVSVLVGRPLVAFTSFVARRWPLAWYWHPKVRPAYSEVTWMWVVFFGLRLLLQFNLFQAEAASLLGLVQLLTGWPATIVLLIVSYLYGTWRLGNLGGPSVEEFKSGAEPPWEGQRRGF